jgi:hypothetical protein
MARLGRSEVFSYAEVAVVHVMTRVVRKSFLIGTDPETGKCYDHRRQWIEVELERLASGFAIDLISYALMSNHFHLVLRSRPDVVETWDDTEVARRWLVACPIRKGASEPTEAELNSIRFDADRVQEIRRRLSDISWWMKLLCQRIAQRANRESEESGCFWSGRFKAVRLLDEAAVLACAAYVDLNPIRAAMVETLELSRFTSAQKRCEAMRKEAASAAQATDSPVLSPDRFLAPVEIDEQSDPVGPRASTSGHRASDKGFLPMSAVAYLELLDWTARRRVAGKRGATPEATPPILVRLSLTEEVWFGLVSDFGKLFHSVAGKPKSVDQVRSRKRRRKFRLSNSAQSLLQFTE